MKKCSPVKFTLKNHLIYPHPESGPVLYSTLFLKIKCTKARFVALFTQDSFQTGNISY